MKMSNSALLARVLDRPIWDIPLDEAFTALTGKRILITGGEGSIGQALATKIQENTDCYVKITDIDSLDVRDLWKVDLEFCRAYPDYVFHLAGAKHAPSGELDPVAVAETNITGTVNVVKAAKNCQAKVILASTCKACDPETAYGASKLIAERIVLGAGGLVARFYNVIETSGNVFEIWDEQLARNEGRLTVTGCQRFFITLSEAVGLLLTTITLPSGRYCVIPGKRRDMWAVAGAYCPGISRTWIKERRGDRLNEILHGTSETGERLDTWLMKVNSPHEDDVT